MIPEDLAALRAATPQCPEWDAEPYSSHITVWPKADHARVFRVLAYWYGCSYSDLFRRMVEHELIGLIDEGDINHPPPRVSKKVTARARVGADVVPDELADGVREYLIFEHTQPAQEDDWLLCQEEGCGNLVAVRGDEFCGNHEVDEYGVREVDCYCSQGHADNMDIDICDHHRRVWQ